MSSTQRAPTTHNPELKGTSTASSSSSLSVTTSKRARVAIVDRGSGDNLTPPVLAVFGTVELLEHILESVDFKTLLLSQRVNKKFKATIDGSLILQCKLWFQPTPGAENWEDDDLLHPFLTDKTIAYEADEDDIYNKDPFTPGLTMANPPFTMTFCPSFDTNKFPDGSWTRMIPYQPTGRETHVFLRPFFMHASRLPKVSPSSTESRLPSFYVGRQFTMPTPIYLANMTERFWRGAQEREDWLWLTDQL